MPQDQDHFSKLVSIWEELTDFKFTLSEIGRESLHNFLKRLPPEDIYEAMVIAADRIPTEKIQERFKYFCGVCWTRIKNDNEPTNIIYKKRGNKKAPKFLGAFLMKRISARFCQR